MKSIKILILLLTLTFGVAKAQFTKAELQISGLTCSMCSKATEKALRTLDFIGDIKTDLNRNVFVLTFKNNTQVNLDQISKKVQNAGFSINSLNATFIFTGVQLNNNMFSYSGDTYIIVNGGDKALNGPVAITMVDKGFASVSVYKKYVGQSTGAKTGKVYRVII